MMTLRKLHPDDLKDYAFWLEPHHRYHQLNGPYYPKKDGEEITEYIHFLLTAFENGNEDPIPNKKMIVDSTDQLLGEVSWTWKSRETNWMEVGIVIFDEVNWGRGLGAKTLSLWISELFAEKPELVRLGFTTWSGNLGMVKLAKKLGMKKEATIRKARVVDGKHFDSVSFGVLREEWDLFSE